MRGAYFLARTNEKSASKLIDRQQTPRWECDGMARNGMINCGFVEVCVAQIHVLVDFPFDFCSHFICVAVLIIGTLGGIRSQSISRFEKSFDSSNQSKYLGSKIYFLVDFKNVSFTLVVEFLIYKTVFLS